MAVTACPTGIAHTYMAAEALEKKGRDRHSPQGGDPGLRRSQNILTRDEIAGADAVIIAADKEVDLSRFDGKHVLRVPVAGASTTRRSSSERHPTPPSTTTPGRRPGRRSESLGRKLYKQLMNGVSHMLPFVIGGGILIALAFLLDDPSIDYANFGTNTRWPPGSRTSAELPSTSCCPFWPAISPWPIADRPGLMVGFVGRFRWPYRAPPSCSPAGGSISAGFLDPHRRFAAGYLMLGLHKLCDQLPQALEGIKPVLIYPVVTALIIGLFMCGPSLCGHAEQRPSTPAWPP